MATIRSDVVQIGFDIDFGDLTKLTGQLNDLKKACSGGIAEDAFEDLKENAKEAQKGTGNLRSGLKELAKVSLKKLGSGLEKIGDHLVDIAKKAAGAAYSGLKKLAGITFKGLIAGAGAVAAAVGSSVKAYADYEQLVGGVDTLFKDASGIVQKNAANAFKSAGLSANAYMETVTSFSASLIQSVGGDTAKAAELADMAITDMSDNANKMGTDMASIQNAYQGFAKQNYTMLDNLKLGYGGTKEEMQRLIKDAAKIDKSIDANSMSYANIVKAINVTQKKMGIYGATADEAEKTITGSLNAMKAAWGNTLVSLVQGGDDFDRCVDNLVSSAKAFAKNIKPAIKKALSGVGELVSELSPMIAKEIPSLVAELAPPLASAGVNMVVELCKAFGDNAPLLVNAAKEVVLTVIKAIYEGFTGKQMSGDMFANLKAKVDQAFTAIQKIISGAIQFGQQLMTWLAPVLGFVGNLALNIFGWIGNNINWLLPLVTSLVGAFLLYKGAMKAVKVATTAVNAVQKIMGVTSTALAAKLPAVAAGTKAAGTASASSASQIGMAAKAFMQIGVGLLAAGAGVLLIAAGFWVLAQAAISLAGAGWGAIAVMVGMVAAIALLAWGAAALGTALTAGAVGFLAFGGAVALVGLGFALIGAGAMLAAMALKMVAAVLPQIITYGIQGGLSIAVLGYSLTIFAVGAGLAGAAAIILGAGLLVVAAALLVITAAFAVMTALLLVFTASMAVLTALMVANSTGALMFSVALIQLVTSMMMLTPLILMFTAALLPLSAAMLVIMPTAVLFTASMAALMAVFVVLSPLALLFSAAMLALTPAFVALGVSAPIFANAIKPLSKEFKKIIIPAGLLAAALLPLSAEFVTLAGSAAILLAAMVGLVASTTALSMLFVMTMTMSTLLAASFTLLGASAGRLAVGVIPLTAALSSMVSPLAMVSKSFVAFAAAAKISATAAMALTVMFIAVSANSQLTVVAIMAFVAALGIIGTSSIRTTSVVEGAMTKMLSAMQKVFASAVKLVKSAMKSIEKIINGTKLTDAGVQMINGLIRGMNSRKSAAVSTARSIAQAINAEYRKIQDIHSPSGEWENYGAYQIQGNINGMESKLPKLKSTVDEVGELSLPYSGRYTPGNTTSTSTSSEEVNNYAPSFTLNMNGTVDRTTERTIKNWIREALQDTFDSMGRTAPRVTEV